MRITVVGAGPAGLATAVLLAGTGHDVQILERVAEPVPLGAGLLLQPPGMQVLDTMNCLERILPVSSRISSLHCSTAAGRLIGELNYRDIAPGLFGIGVSRSVLWDALREEAVRRGTEIRGGVSVSSVRNGDAEAVVETNEGAETCDLAVIASGTHTDLWKQPGYISSLYRWGCLWMSPELPDEWTDSTLLQKCRGTEYMCGILPTGRTDGVRRAAVFWSIRADRVEQWRQTELSAWHGEVERIFPEAADMVRRIPREAIHYASYRDVMADPPYCGHTLVVGDAAHGTSPQLGQGTTAAFRDAETLASVLCNSKPGDIPEALRVYARIRRNRTRYYRQASRMLTPVFQSDGKVTGMMRDAFSRYVTAVPYIRRQSLLTLAGAKTGYLGHEPVSLRAISS